MNIRTFISRIFHRHTYDFENLTLNRETWEWNPIYCKCGKQWVSSIPNCKDIPPPPEKPKSPVDKITYFNSERYTEQEEEVMNRLMRDLPLSHSLTTFYNPINESYEWYVINDVGQRMTHMYNSPLAAVTEALDNIKSKTNG